MFYQYFSFLIIQYIKFFQDIVLEESIFYLI